MDQFFFFEDEATSTLLLTAGGEPEAEIVIPDRNATVRESLQLIGEGWGSIFIVILIMIVVILGLNKVFSKKKK